MAAPHKQEFPPLLPLGFHPMTLAEMRVVLVDNIRGSVRRKPVMDGLEKVIQKIIAEGLEAEVWINGSLLTKKIDPLDSDILVVLKSDFLAAATPAQKATIAWLNTDLKPSHLCHSQLFLDCPVGHPEHSESRWWHAYWLRQFGFSRKDEPKGIVLIKTP
jgi:hypothetical protein